ncbi:MAG: solute-binding protein [Methylacidiphilales bacterium]|nr:solute-binding protein [Candidatus Methylacidiphilales bacterium]
MGQDFQSNRIALSLAAALALCGPASAQETTWDKFVEDPVATGGEFLNSLKSSLGNWTRGTPAVTLTMCWGSDKTAIADDPAIIDAWLKQPGNEKIKITFPRDANKKLFGSGDVMKRWESGEDDCSTVSPDASIVGMRSAKWDPSQAILIASSMVVAVVNPDVAEVIGKHYGKDPNALTFPELVQLAGKTWSDIDPSKDNWGLVKVLASNCARSASCQVVAVSLPYSAKKSWSLSGRDIDDPAVKDILDAYKNNVDHSESSTSRLTQQCFLNPVSCDVFFTYESQVPDIEKNIPGARVLYGDRVVQADHAVMITATDPAVRAAAARFVDYMRSAPVQKRLAEHHGLRPAVVVQVDGPVAKLKQMRLGMVKPNPIFVKATLAYVTAGK